MLVLANVSKTYPQRRPRPARNLAADRPRPVRFAWPERRRQVHADAHDRHVAGARSARPPRAAHGTHGPHDTPCAGRGATGANNAHWPPGHGCVADVIQATPRSISGKCCRTPNPAIHYESTTSPAGRSSSRRRFGWRVARRVHITARRPAECALPAHYGSADAYINSAVDTSLCPGSPCTRRT